MRDRSRDLDKSKKDGVNRPKVTPRLLPAAATPPTPPAAPRPTAPAPSLTPRWTSAIARFRPGRSSTLLLPRRAVRHLFLGRLIDFLRCHQNRGLDAHGPAGVDREGRRRGAHVVGDIHDHVG